MARNKPFKEQGARFKQARSRERLTLAKAADRIGVSPQTVVGWESGRSLPEGRNLSKAATVYGVDGGWLVGLREESAAQTVMEEAELALRGAATELTEEEMQSVADFIQFVRRQKREKGTP